MCIAGDIMRALTVRDISIGFQAAEGWLRVLAGAVLTGPRVRLRSDELTPVCIQTTREKLRLLFASFIEGAFVFGDWFQLECDLSAIPAAPDRQVHVTPGASLFGAPYPTPATGRRYDQPHYFPCGRGRIIVCARDNITKGWL